MRSIRDPRARIRALLASILELLSRLALALLPCALAAQDKGWSLPRHGAVEFTREWALTTKVTETKEAPPPAEENPDLWIFRGIHQPALVLQGELDKEQRAFVAPPVDLREGLRRTIAFFREHMSEYVDTAGEGQQVRL